MTSALGSFIFLIATFLVLSDARPIRIEETSESTDKTKNTSNKFLELLQVQVVRGVLVLGTCCGLALAIFLSTFSLVAQQRYNINAQQNGMIMSYIGGLTTLVNTFFVGWVTSKLSASQIVKYSSILIMLMFIALSFTPPLFLALLLFFPLIAGAATFRVVTTSVLTQAVSFDDTGTILALDMATGSLSRGIAPVLGGYLLRAGPQYVPLFALCLMVLLFVVNFRLDPYPKVVVKFHEKSS